MKGFKDKNNKFHPITQTKGIRKSRDQKVKQEGVRMKRYAKSIEVSNMNDFTLDLRIDQLQDEVQRRNALEVTGVPNSDIAKIKKMLVTAKEEKRKRIANPKTQSQLAEHLVQKINKSLKSGLKFPYNTSNIRDITIKANGKQGTFKVSMQSHDDQTVKEIEGAGFKAVEITDILDARHVTFEGDLGLG